MEKNVFACQIHPDHHIIFYCQNKQCERKGGYCDECQKQNNHKSHDCQISPDQIKKQLEDHIRVSEDRLNQVMLHQEIQNYFINLEFVKLRKQYETNQQIKKHFEKQKKISLENYSKKDKLLNEYLNEDIKKIIMNDRIISSYLNNQDLPIELDQVTDNEMLDNFKEYYFENNMTFAMENIVQNEHLKKIKEYNTPEDDDNFSKLIEFMVKEGNENKYKKLLEQVFQLFKFLKDESNKIYFNALLENTLGNNDKCLNMLKESENKNIKSYKLEYIKGKILSDQNKIDEPLQQFEKSQKMEVSMSLESQQQEQQKQQKQLEARLSQTYLKNEIGKGQVFHKNDQLDKAKFHYERCIKIAPFNYYPCQQLAIIYFNQGMFNEALQFINQSISLYPILQELIDLKLKILQSLQKHEEYYNFIEQVTAIYPTPDYQNKKVKIQIVLNKREDAKDTYKEMIKKDPLVYDLYDKLTQLHVEEQRPFQEIEVILKPYVEIQKSDYRPIQQMINIQIAYKKPVEERLKLIDDFININHNNCLQAQIDKGSFLCQLNRHQEAIALYEKILQQNQIDLHQMEIVYLQKVKAFQEMRRYIDSLILLDKITIDYPQLYQPVYEKTILLQKLNRHKEAINLHDSFIAVNPNNQEALTNKAIFFPNNQSIDILDRAIQIDINNFIPYREKGQMLHQMNSYQEELQNYNQFLFINPQSQEGYIQKIKILKELYQKRLVTKMEVLEACDQLIKLDPKNFDYTYMKGDFLYKIQDHQSVNEAFDLYDRYLKANPYEFKAYYNKAQILLNLKYDQQEEAISVYKDYLIQVPNHQKAIYKIGKIYYCLNQYDNALENFKHVINLESQNQKALEFLAKIFSQQNQHKNAIDIYERNKSLQFRKNELIQFAISFVKIKDYKNAYQIFSQIKQDSNQKIIHRLFKLIHNFESLPNKSQLQIDELIRNQSEAHKIIQKILSGLIDHRKNTQEPLMLKIKQFYYKLLQGSEAKRFYDEFVENFPNQLYCLEVKYYKSQQKWLEAIQTLEKLIELDQDNLLNYEKLVSYNKKLNQYDQALKFQEVLIDKFPNQLKYKIEKADILFLKEEYQKAHEYIDKINNSQDMSILRLKANSLFKLNCYIPCIEVAKEILELSKFQDENSYELLAESYNKLGDYDTAIELYDQLIMLNNQEIRYFYQRAIIFQKIDRHEEAIQVFDQAILSKYKIDETNNYKINSLIKLKRYQEALTILEDRQLDDQRIKDLLKQWLYKQTLTLELYDKYINLNPGQYNVYFPKIQFLQSIKQTVQALNILDGLLNKYPNQLEIYYEKSLLYQNLNQHKNIIQDIYKYVNQCKNDIDENNIILLLPKIIIEKRVQLEIYNQLIEKNKLIFAFYVQKSQLLFELNYIPDAIKVYRDYLKMNPQNIQAYNLLAELYYTLNEQMNALQIHQECLDQKLYSDKDKFVSQQLGEMLKKQNKIKKALSLIEEFTRKNPKNLDALLYHSEFQDCSNKIQIYDQILSMEKFNREIYQKKSQFILQQAKNDDQSKKTALNRALLVQDEYIQIKPDDINAYVYKCKILISEWENIQVRQVNQSVLKVFDDYVSNNNKSLNYADSLVFVDFLIQNERKNEAETIIRKIQNFLTIEQLVQISLNMAREIDKEMQNEVKYSINYFHSLTKEKDQDELLLINKLKLFQNKALINDKPLIEICDELINLNQNDSMHMITKYQYLIRNWQGVYESYNKKIKECQIKQQIDRQNDNQEECYKYVEKIKDYFNEIIDYILENLKIIINQEQPINEEYQQKKYFEDSLRKFYKEKIKFLLEIEPENDTILEIYDKLITLEPSESNYEDQSKICIKLDKTIKSIEIYNQMIKLYPQSLKGYQLRAQLYKKELMEIESQIENL